MKNRFVINIALSLFVLGSLGLIAVYAPVLAEMQQKQKTEWQRKESVHKAALNDLIGLSKKRLKNLASKGAIEESDVIEPEWHPTALLYNAAKMNRLERERLRQDVYLIHLDLLVYEILLEKYPQLRGQELLTKHEEIRSEQSARSKEIMLEARKRHASFVEQMDLQFVNPQ